MMIRKRRAAGVAASVAALSLVATACGGGSDAPEGGNEGAQGSEGLAACEEDQNACNEAEVQDGGEVTGLISLPFEAWSDITATGNSVYVLQAIDGTRPNGGSRYEPDGTWVWDEEFFAETPTLTSEDPQTIEFTIAEEAVWSDGTPITATDIQYYWYALSGDETKCGEGCEPVDTTDWGKVASVESEDGKTVTITLKDGELNPEWEPAYGGVVPHPAHVIEEAGFDWQNDPKAMADSMKWLETTMPTWSGGPWMIESGTLNETVVKVPNESYWGEQPNLEKLTQEVVADPATWIQALNNRDLDMGSPATFDVDVWNELPTVQDLEYSAGSAGAVWEHIDLNLENQFLQDPALRQAIFTAIDVEHASNAIWGTAEGLEVTPRTNHTFSELSPYHEDQRTDTGFGSGDTEAAAQILTDAGYTGAEPDGTLTTPEGEEVAPLRFRWTAGNTNRARMGELVQSYLSDIGITIELVDSDDLGGMLVGGDFDLVIFGWSGSPRFVGSLGQLWSSGSESNFPRVKNDEIDRLAQEATAQTDMDAAADVANQLSQVLMDEAAVLPLWDSPNMDFAFNDIGNIRPNHQSSLRMYYNADDWGLKAN